MPTGNDNWLQRIWYGGSPWYLLLMPLSWLYGALAAVRRMFYAIGVLQVKSVAAPVVVIGNVTAGGTGKTPITIWLARQLTERGLHPGIVSRGYGGRVGATPVAATAQSDPKVVGDEAVLMAIRSECPVVVHPDRVAAAREALRLGADIVIADDGLQHYRLKRDFEIAVVDGARGAGNGHLLPAGPLREPVSRLTSVDLVLLKRDGDASLNPLRRSSDRLPMEFELVATTVRKLDDSASRDLKDFRDQKVHAVAGIGNPDRFFRLLESHGIETIRHPLPDHVEIRHEHIAFDDGRTVLMTEKDAVKCRWLDTAHCWYVPVSVEIDVADAEDLVEMLISKIPVTTGDAKP